MLQYVHVLSVPLANSWDVDVTARICQIPAHCTGSKGGVITKSSQVTSYDKWWQGGCKSQKMTPKSTWFLIVSRWKEVHLGSLTTEHKEQSLYSQITTAGPAQHSENLNSQRHRKIKNAGQRHTQSIRKKRENRKSNSNFRIFKIFATLFNSDLISDHPHPYHPESLLALPCTSTVKSWCARVALAAEPTMLDVLNRRDM